MSTEWTLQVVFWIIQKFRIFTFTKYIVLLFLTVSKWKTVVFREMCLVLTWQYLYYRKKKRFSKITSYTIVGLIKVSDSPRVTLWPTTFFYHKAKVPFIHLGLLLRVLSKFFSKYSNRIFIWFFIGPTTLQKKKSLVLSSPTITDFVDHFLSTYSFQFDDEYQHTWAPKKVYTSWRNGTKYVNSDPTFFI